MGKEINTEAIRLKASMRWDRIHNKHKIGSSTDLSRRIIRRIIRKWGIVDGTHTILQQLNVIRNLKKYKVGDFVCTSFGEDCVISHIDYELEKIYGLHLEEGGKAPYINTYKGYYCMMPLTVEDPNGSCVTETIIAPFDPCKIKGYLKDIKPWLFTIDYSNIDYMEFDSVDHKDAPDYCDVFATYAEVDGVELTGDQLDTLNDKYHNYVYEMFIEENN